MRKNSVDFLIYEFLGAFFIITYEEATDLFGHVVNPAHSFDAVLGEVLVPWTWLLVGIGFIALGIYKLQKYK